MHAALERLRHPHALAGSAAIPRELSDPGARLTHLLAKLAGQDFAELVSSRLLSDVEQIVIDAHRRLYESDGLAWSKPTAYHWLRYENADPVERLKDGVKRLRRRGVMFDPDAVEKACGKASKKGFLI
jgi:hypothetical protein